jgi:bifunctional non-homologous end joining protein LigD
MLVDDLPGATYSAAMPLPRGFVPPCLPTKAPQPPSGDTWIHEIKHDGFRVIARKKDLLITSGYCCTNL